MGAGKKLDFGLAEARTRELQTTDEMVAVRPGTPPLGVTATVEKLIALVLQGAGFTTRGQVSAIVQQALGNLHEGESATQVEAIVRRIVDIWATVDSTAVIPFTKTDVAALLSWLGQQGFIRQTDLNAILRAISGLFDTETLVTKKRVRVDERAWNTLPFDGGATVPTDLATLMTLHIDGDDDADDATYEFVLSELPEGTQGAASIPADRYTIPDAIDGQPLYLSRNPDENTNILIQMGGQQARSAQLTLTAQSLEELNVNKPTLSGNVLTFYVRIGSNIVSVPITLPVTGHAPSRHNEAANIFYQGTLVGGARLLQYQQDADANPVLSTSNFPMRLYFQDETSAAYSWSAYAEFQRAGPVSDGGAATSGNGTRIDHGDFSIFISRQRRANGNDYWIVAPANAAAVGQRIEIQGVASTQHATASATAANVDPLVGALLSMHPAITYDASANTLSYTWRWEDFEADVQTTLTNAIDRTQLSEVGTLTNTTVEDSDSLLLDDNSVSAGQTQLKRISLTEYEKRLQPLIDREIGFSQVIRVSSASQLLLERSTHGTLLAIITQNITYANPNEAPVQYKVGDLLIKTGRSAWSPIRDVITTRSGLVPPGVTAFSLIAQYVTPREDVVLDLVDQTTHLRWGNGLPGSQVMDASNLTTGQIDAQILGLDYDKASRLLSVWVEDPSQDGLYDDKILVAGREYDLTASGVNRGLQNVPFGTGNNRGIQYNITLATALDEHAQINFADTHAEADDTYWAGNPHFEDALLDPSRVGIQPDELDTYIASWALATNTDPIDPAKIRFAHANLATASAIPDNSIYIADTGLAHLKTPTRDDALAKVSQLNDNDFPNFSRFNIALGDAFSVPVRKHTDEAEHKLRVTWGPLVTHTVPAGAGQTRTYQYSIGRITDPTRTDGSLSPNLPRVIDHLIFYGPQHYQSALQNRIFFSPIGNGLNRYGSGITYAVQAPGSADSTRSLITITIQDTSQPANVRGYFGTPVLSASDRITAGQEQDFNILTPGAEQSAVFLTAASDALGAITTNDFGFFARWRTVFTANLNYRRRLSQLINGRWSTSEDMTFKPNQLSVTGEFQLFMKLKQNENNESIVIYFPPHPTIWFHQINGIHVGQGQDWDQTASVRRGEVFASGRVALVNVDAAVACNSVRYNNDVGGRIQTVGDLSYDTRNNDAIFNFDHYEYWAETGVTQLGGRVRGT